MNKKELLRNNLSKYFQAGTIELMEELFASDSSEVTQEKAIQIANAISQINVANIRLYGSSNVGNWKLPLILNDKETVNLVNTSGQEKIFYISSQLPTTIKANENFNPVLSNGEYIGLSFGDNFGSTQNLYKNIQKDTLLGIMSQSGTYIQIDKQDFGSDLQQAATVNFEVDNQTNSTFRFRADVQYASKKYLDILPNSSKTDSFTPYTNWNYFYPYWGADLRNESQNIILELWKADMSQLIANTYAYAGNNYQGLNLITQINPQSWNTQDYKLIIKYQ